MSETTHLLNLCYTSVETFIFLYYKNCNLSFTLFLIYELFGCNLKDFKKKTLDFKLHFVYCFVLISFYFFYYNHILLIPVVNNLLITKCSNPIIYVIKLDYIKKNYNNLSKFLFYIAFFIFRIYYSFFDYINLIKNEGFIFELSIPLTLHILNLYWFYILSYKLLEVIKSKL